METKIKILEKENNSSIFLKKNIEFELPNVPNTIVRLDIQIIFFSEDDEKFELDCIEIMEQKVIFNHIELKDKYNDENCQFNRFVDFYDSLGVDIQKLIDAIFNEWEEENRQSGYFNSLLNGHKEKLNAY